jgi:hypothetical protein
MCKHKVLSKNSYGCIVQHACTGKLHLGFGNILAVFTEQELNDFYAVCRKLEQNHSEYGLEDEQNYYVHTGSRQFVLMLKIHEIKQILSLIEEAVLLLDVNKILYEKE